MQKDNKEQTKKLRCIPYMLNLITLIIIILSAGVIAIYYILQDSEPAITAAANLNIQSPSFSEALSIMQSQYDTYLSSISLILTVVIALFALFNIATPIFNYIFFQKEQITKIEGTIKHAEDSFKKEIESVIEESRKEIIRLRKSRTINRVH